MIDVFNPREEREELIEGLSLGSSITEVRRATETDKEGLPFIWDLEYVIELQEKYFPVTRVYVGCNGTSFELGDGKIFVDRRNGRSTIKHEMIHSWYGSLNANQLRDILDTYIAHEPDYLTANRGSTWSNPLISYRKLLAQHEKYPNPSGEKHSLLEKVGSLNEALAMKAGTIVDDEYASYDGTTKLLRYVKTDDRYRDSEIPDEDESEEESGAFLRGDKEEFLDVSQTANEYLAYRAMSPEPEMRKAIYEAMKRNGYRNEHFENVVEQVHNVVMQLNNIDKVDN